MYNFKSVDRIKILASKSTKIHSCDFFLGLILHADDITKTMEPLQIVTIYRNHVGALSIQFYRNDLSDQLYRSDKQLRIGPALRPRSIPREVTVGAKGCSKGLMSQKLMRTSHKNVHYSTTTTRRGSKAKGRRGTDQ